MTQMHHDETTAAWIINQTPSGDTNRSRDALNTLTSRPMTAQESWQHCPWDHAPLQHVVHLSSFLTESDTDVHRHRKRNFKYTQVILSWWNCKYPFRLNNDSVFRQDVDHLFFSRQKCAIVPVIVMRFCFCNIMSLLWQIHFAVCGTLKIFWFWFKPNTSAPQCSLSTSQLTRVCFQAVCSLNCAVTSFHGAVAQQVELLEIPAPPSWTELHVEVPLSNTLNPKPPLCSRHQCELGTCSGSTRDSWDWLQQKNPCDPLKGMKRLQTLFHLKQASHTDPPETCFTRTQTNIMKTKWTLNTWQTADV